MKRCKTCGKVLESTGSGPEWMNEEQWDAVKAGDYFAPCEAATHPNGNCYFDSDTLSQELLTPIGPRPPTL